MTHSDPRITRILESLATTAPLPALDDAELPADLEQAYRLQAEVNAARSGTLGRPVGYKVAYVAPDVQPQIDHFEPMFAPLFESGLMGSPVTLDPATFRQLGVECEVAFRMARDLPPADAPYSQEQVEAAVECAMPAIEVLNMRFPDGYDLRRRTLISLSANVWNAGVVLGEPVTDWRERDLAAATGTLKVDGETVITGPGTTNMGHPVAPLVWLVNELSARGITLKAGEIVITGSLFPPQPIAPGCTVEIGIDALGAPLTIHY